MEESENDPDEPPPLLEDSSDCQSDFDLPVSPAPAHPASVSTVLECFEIAGNCTNNVACVTNNYYVFVYRWSRVEAEVDVLHRDCVTTIQCLDQCVLSHPALPSFRVVSWFHDLVPYDIIGDRESPSLRYTHHHFTIAEYSGQAYHARLITRS